MSGGHFDYREYVLEEIIDQIEHVISVNDSKGIDKWGSPIGWGFQKKTIEEFQKAIDIIRQAYIYIHRIDYLLSSDDGEDSFHARLQEELSRKTNK